MSRTAFPQMEKETLEREERLEEIRERLRTMTKYTPGPWEYSAKLTASENHRGFSIVSATIPKHAYWALADVQPGDQDGKLGEANARLIAAAPELLEALKSAIQTMRVEHAINPSYGWGEFIEKELMPAVAKAEGQ